MGTFAAHLNKRVSSSGEKIYGVTLACVTLSAIEYVKRHSFHALRL